MDKVYSFEMWMKSDAGRIVSKVNAKYPGENSFVALLNFIHGIVGEPEVVQNLGAYKIERIMISEMPEYTKDPLRLGIEEVRGD